MRDPSKSRNPSRSPADCAHDRRILRLPSLVELGIRERERILKSESYERFCVTRSPYERLVSGWVNRILLTPSTSAFSRDLESALLSSGSLNLTEIFDVFMNRLAESGDFLSNIHFIPQTSLLEVENFPYTKVLKFDDLQGQFASLAERYGTSVSRPHINESLRISPTRLFSTKSVEVVKELYREDFQSFGYEPGLELIVDPIVLTQREKELVSQLRESLKRINDLSDLARHDVEFLAWRAFALRPSRVRRLARKALRNVAGKRSLSW